MSYLLGPVAILISAVGAWWFAHKAIETNRQIAKKKSTFDYMTKLSWDQDYIEAKNRFLAINAGTKKLRAIAEEYEATKRANNLDEQEIKKIILDHSSIKNILNEYEAMAIAIKVDALDGEMIRANIQQQFISHIDACSEFINYTRSQSGFSKPEKVWCEVQALADEWRKLV